MSLPVFCLLAFAIYATKSQSTVNLGATYPSNSWMNADKTFRLWWKYIAKNAANQINQDMFQFALEAQTTGWVGMGISPNGQMPDSDMAIGWVDSNGNAFVEDRNSFGGRVSPAKDALQNVTLVGGKEVGGWTVVEFMRPRISCEPKDLDIPVGSARIIFAYSPSNKDGPNIDFHRTGTKQKGVKTLNLDSTGRRVPSAPTNAQNIDLVFGNYSVPSKTTTYACQLFELPALSKKVHIIEILPNIPINTNIVHHSLLYACPPQHNSALSTGKSQFANLSHPHECRTHGMITIKECYNGLLIAAWAVGGEGIVFPNQTGYPIGGSNPATSVLWVMMETHYDNPAHIPGIFDSSGLTLKYTPTLRQYDATIIWGGLPADHRQWIPPNSPPGTLLWNSSPVPAGCLSAAMDAANVTSVHVIFSFLHMHNLGRSIKIRHFRNGAELKPIDKNPNYDFDFQQTVPVDAVIQKGDSLLLECGMSSRNITQMTYGGIASADEMCMFFFTLYPALDLGYIGSIFDRGTTYANWLSASSSFLTYDANSRRVTSYNLSYPGATQAYHDLYNSGKTVANWATRCNNVAGARYPWSASSLIPFPTVSNPYVPPSRQAICDAIAAISPTTAAPVGSKGARGHLWAVVFVHFVVVLVVFGSTWWD